MVLFGAVLKKSNKRRAILLWSSLGPPWGACLWSPWGVPGEALGASLGAPGASPGGIDPGDCDSKTINNIILKKYFKNILRLELIFFRNS